MSVLSYQPPATNPTPNSSASSPRLRYVDGLRGLAALWVTLFHLHGVGRTGELLAELLPAPLLLLFAHGDRGVDIFFVLSGFVIAYSIRGARVDVGYAASFFVRRSVRLDPPYWLTIAIVVSLNALSRSFLPDSIAALPSWGQLAANVFYLQDLLGVGSILTVFWTLCLELQFYVVLIALMVVVDDLDGRVGSPFAGRALGLVMVPMAILAVLVPAGFVANPRGLFLSHWYMFLLGSFTWWVLSSRISLGLWLTFAGALGTVAAVHLDLGAAVALATATSLLMVGKRGRLSDALGARWLQYLGAISYSMYLLHLPVGARVVNVVARLLPDGHAAACVAFVVGVGATIAASRAFWWAVERPFMNLSKRFRPRARPIGAVSTDRV